MFSGLINYGLGHASGKLATWKYMCVLHGFSRCRPDLATQVPVCRLVDYPLVDRCSPGNT